MKRSNRLVWLAAIALGAIILLTLIVAPSNSKLNIGSTYSRTPDGYGAWYDGSPLLRVIKKSNKFC